MKIDIPSSADRAAQAAYAAAGGDGVWWSRCMPDCTLTEAAGVMKELVGAVRALHATDRDLWDHCAARFFDVYPWSRASAASKAAIATFRREAEAGWRLLDAELDRLERRPRLRDVRALR